MPDSLPASAYRALFRSLPGLYLLLAPDGLILDNSDDHVAASLLPREYAVGRDIFAAYPSAPESQQPLRESHERVRAMCQPDTMPLTRYDVARPGGTLEERYWQITHYPLLAPDGTLQYILQRAEDVTDRHRAEQQARAMAIELAETQERAQFTLEALPVLVWTAEATGRIDYANERARQFTGHSADGRTIEQSLGDIHPDDRDRVAAARREAVTTGTEYQIEYRLRRHDGVYRWLLARGIPRLDAAGRIQMWVGCAIDNHDQRQLVEELLRSAETQATLGEQTYQAHQRSESQRQTLYDLMMQAPALLSIVRGPTFVYDFVNPIYQQLFPNRELLGRPLAEAVPEAVEQGFVALVDEVYRMGIPFKGNEMRLELPAEGDHPAREVYFNFTYQPFKENGQTVGVMSFAYDVTELVQARLRLEYLLPPVTP